MRRGCFFNLSARSQFFLEVIKFKEIKFLFLPHVTLKSWSRPAREQFRKCRLLVAIFSLLGAFLLYVTFSTHLLFGGFFEFFQSESDKQVFHFIVAVYQTSFEFNRSKQVVSFEAGAFLNSTEARFISQAESSKVQFVDISIDLYRSKCCN